MVKIWRSERCYIEELPDEILGDIVSRLKTIDAARSCCVSRRWSKLWTLSSCKNLDFDFPDSKLHSSFAIGRIDRATEKHDGPLVDHFRVAFQDHKDVEHRRCEYYLSLFEFANVKRVQSLVMDVRALVAIPDTPDPSCHPFDTMNIAILPTIANITRDRLTTVSLTSVIMFDEDVSRFLSASPNLETLLLDNVPFTHLEVKDTNPRLRRLEILHCAVLNRIDIISAPNLESFKHVPLMNYRFYGSLRGLPFKKKRKPYYVGVDNDYLIQTNISLRIGHATKLRDVFLGGPLCRNMLSEIQKHAPLLEKLQLNMDLVCDHRKECSREPYNRTINPTLGNLKQLQLTFTSTMIRRRDYDKMITVINIVHSCPCLEKLTLKYEIQRVDTADENYCYYDNPAGRNGFLREVEVAGWSGLKSEVELVRYLIRTSPKLGRLSLDPTPETSWSGLFSPVKRADHEVEYAALAARQLIACLHNKLAK